MAAAEATAAAEAKALAKAARVQGKAAAGGDPAEKPKRVKKVVANAAPENDGEKRLPGTK